MSKPFLPCVFLPVSSASHSSASGCLLAQWSPPSLPASPSPTPALLFCWFLFRSPPPSWLHPELAASPPVFWGSARADSGDDKGKHGRVHFFLQKPVRGFANSSTLVSSSQFIITVNPSPAAAALWEWPASAPLPLHLPHPVLPSASPAPPAASGHRTWTDDCEHKPFPPYPHKQTGTPQHWGEASTTLQKKYKALPFIFRLIVSNTINLNSNRLIDKKLLSWIYLVDLNSLGFVLETVEKHLKPVTASIPESAAYL